MNINVWLRMINGGSIFIGSVEVIREAWEQSSEVERVAFITDFVMQTATIVEASRATHLEYAAVPNTIN